MMYYKPRKRRVSLAEARKWCLPYGYWTMADGTKVYFNRWYYQLYHRRPNGAVEEPEQPRAHIDYVEQHFFFNDSLNPFKGVRSVDQKLRRTLLDTLNDLGFPFYFSLVRDRVPEEPWSYAEGGWRYR